MKTCESAGLALSSKTIALGGDPGWFDSNAAISRLNSICFWRISLFFIGPNRGRGFSADLSQS